MRTKKVIILSTNDYDISKIAENRIEKIGIKILKVSFNVIFDRYDLVMKVTKEQAYELLDLANEIGAILWKGES